MAGSVQWNFLENYGRGTSIANFPEWINTPETSGSPSFSQNDSILGKNAIVFGGASSYSNGYARSITQRGNSPLTQATWSFRFYIKGGSSGNLYFNLLDSTQAVMAQIVINTASLIMSYYAGGTLVYTRPMPDFQYNIPYFLEFNMAVSHTAGTITVRNNEEVLGGEFVGLDTNPNNLAGINYVQGIGQSGVYAAVTDMGVIDPTISGNPQFYGDNNVQYLTATANGTTINFTPNGLPENWQNVANIPPNGSDFNSSTTLGATDQFIVGNLSVLTESVGGVYIVSNAENISGGLHTYSQQWSGSGGNTYGSGSSITLTNGYLTYGDSPATDPNTGAAWTMAGVNGMKIGYTLVS